MEELKYQTKDSTADKICEMQLCQKEPSRVLNLPYICLLFLFYGAKLQAAYNFAGKNHRTMYGKLKMQLNAF